MFASLRLGMRHCRSVFAASLTALVVIGSPIALGGCGSDSASSASPTAATTAKPEDVTVDDATVTAGLTKLPSTIATAIAAIGTPEAGPKLDAIEAEWAGFEGTVRANEPALYLQIEDQLTPLQRQITAGDSATANTTASTLAGLFSQYLGKHS